MGFTYKKKNTSVSENEKFDNLNNMGIQLENLSSKQFTELKNIENWANYGQK